MGVKWLKTSLEKQKVDLFLRLDVKYHSVIDTTKWNIFECKSNGIIELKHILIPYYEPFDFQDGTYKGIPTGREYIDEYGDIISFQNITLEDHPGRLKYKADNECILLSSLRVARTPALNLDGDLSDYVFSNGFYIFKINKDWNIKFVLNLLRHDKIKDIIDNAIYRGIGISSYREDDLLKIKIPRIPLSLQNCIVEQIKPIEQEISVLKSSKTPHIDIINEEFGQEFGFDWKKFERLKEQKIYSLNLGNSSRSVDCRLGCRFHQPVAKYVMDFMSKHTNKRIKDFCSEPICLGASVSPADYDESGEFKYVAMSSFPNWELNIEDSKNVSDEYARKNQNKTLQKGDIVLARSGEGTIGKVALVTDENIQAVFADFTQRIRLNNYNQTFAYFYFRSMFFQYLVYKEKKGLGNNTNIFPSQIQDFPIPDYSLDKQQEIVSKIETRINAQKEIDKQIADKRQEISRLIESAIKQV